MFVLFLGGCDRDSPGETSETADPSETGAPRELTCTEEAPYTEIATESCGEFRWNVKTGQDGRADEVALVPVTTTIATLVGASPPDGLDDDTKRQAPIETTLWRLTNVQWSFVKASDDSDYHLVLGDGTNTLISEVPYPGCIEDGVWDCPISYARAAVEAEVTPDRDGAEVDFMVSVVGIGFFDDIVPTREGQAPNGVEIHPVLGLCVGEGCDPMEE